MLEENDPTEPVFEFDPFDLANRLLDRGAAEPVRPPDFGRYRFLQDKPLGRGAMADVWLAKEEAIDRLVAIKLLRRTSEPEVWLGREIQRLGALENRFIARLYSHGILEDGTPWLAMEYVEGEPLDKHCRDRRCSIVERLALFRAVCEGVQYAHGRGIIHGDLKPSNIRVNKDGDPKLLDFGLAEQVQIPDGKVTRSPSPLGFTPAYASPEQFRREPVGTYIDVYALGVILYELLTGTLPFHTYAEIEETKASERKPEPPSVVVARSSGENDDNGAIAKIGRAGWRDLDAICLKAMEGDINHRYPSVEALIQDVDRFGSCEPLRARLPHTWTYRFGKFTKRNRIAFGVAVLIVGSVAGLVTYYTIQLARERNAAVAEAARTQKVKQFFLDVFDHAAEDALPAEKTRFVNLFLDRGTRDARSLGQDPAIQADIYQGFGTMYQEWGVLDRAEQLTRQAVALDESHFSKNDPAVVKAKLALGEVLDDRGKYDEAIEIGNEVSRIPPAKSEYPASLTLLANAQIHLGHLSVADSLSQRALAADRQLHGQNDPAVADDLMNLGNLQIERGNYPEAEKSFRQALAINQSWFGKDSPQAADSASYFGQALYFQDGRETEAASVLTDALAVLEKTQGKIDFRVAFAIAQMGAVAMELGRLDEAEADFKRAIGIYQTVKGDEHQNVTIELSNLASVYLKKKDYVLAERSFRDVIQRFAKTLPEDNPNIGIARIKLGDALLGQKRYKESEVELLSGYQILAKQTSPSVDWLKVARKDLVLVYSILNRPANAVKFQTELDASETKKATGAK